MKNQKIGILGGIGPQATGYFYSTLITKLKNSGKIKSNADFPNIIINSINAPELTGADISIQQLQPYINGIKELAILKPDYILMVCNTIHVYRDILIRESGYANILSIRKIIEKYLEKYLEKYSGQKFCVLGTTSTIQSGLFSFENVEYINPRVEQLEKITKVIENYNKTGEIESNLSSLLEITNDLKAKGVDRFLTACTELSELLNNDIGTEYISTLDIMVYELCCIMTNCNIDR
jgi:aspartate racemase